MRQLRKPVLPFVWRPVNACARVCTKRSYSCNSVNARKLLLLPLKRDTISLSSAVAYAMRISLYEIELDFIVRLDVQSARINSSYLHRGRGVFGFIDAIKTSKPRTIFRLGRRIAIRHAKNWRAVHRSLP